MATRCTTGNSIREEHLYLYSRRTYVVGILRAALDLTPSMGYSYAKMQLFTFQDVEMEDATDMKMVLF
jgi:hypothetical protein